MPVQRNDGTPQGCWIPRPSKCMMVEATDWPRALQPRRGEDVFRNHLRCSGTIVAAPGNTSTYHKPERLPDLAELHERIPRFFVDADVLEIACGTGYWTTRIAGAARSIVATDRSREVLEIARSKQYPKENVRFAIADAFDLTFMAGTFTAAFGGFWCSHVRRDELRSFLGQFHGQLAPGARVLWVDNRYVDGSSTPVSRADAEGNTYQVRMLGDGSTHEVLKNFPSSEELYAAIDDPADDVSLTQLEYYWCLGYRLRPAIP